MKKEWQEMANRLRKNQAQNARNYQKRSQQAEKRMHDSELLSQTNFASTVDLKKQHLKAKSRT